MFGYIFYIKTEQQNGSSIFTTDNRNFLVQILFQCKDNNLSIYKLKNQFIFQQQSQNQNLKTKNTRIFILPTHNKFPFSDQQNIQINMNCKLCSQSFKLQNPRKLPRVLTQCGHTFCDQCIKINLNLYQQLICKECNKVNYPLKQGNFPLNQTLLALLKNNGQGICEFIKESEVCKIHGKKLQAFCENDQISLCLNCILSDHKSHRVLSIIEKVQKQKDLLKCCEQNIIKSQDILKKKQQECSSLIDRLQMDLNEYVFEINLLYKSIISQLKQSQQNFINDTRKNIEKGIKQIKTIEENVKQKREFYGQLMRIYEDVKQKSGVQFLNETNKRLFVIQNSSIKQRFNLPYKKEEIHKQKILTQAIKSLQQFVQFQRKKTNSNNEKKNITNNQNQLHSQSQNASQIKNIDKALKLNLKDDSFSKSITQSPCRMQKKSISSVQKVPQILYEKHQQAKNMKKRGSQISVSTKGKSPKIQYEVKRGIQISEKNNSKYSSSNDNFKNKNPVNIRQINNSLNKTVLSEDKNITYSKLLQQGKTQEFGLSFFNQSCLINSPQNLKNQNQTFQMETPLSIHSFMESSQCTIFNQRKDETILKDSRASFSYLYKEEKIYHFGGTNNNSICCQKILPNSINLSNQNCVQGLFRSKAQCVIMKSYHPKKCLILGGKNSNGEKSNAIYSYDIQRNKLQTTSFQLNQAISGFGAVVYDDKLYVCGGSTLKQPINTFYQYKYAKNELDKKKLASMINSRDQLGFAMGFDGCLYVGGGVSKSNSILNSCQKYCFQKKKWSAIAAMKNPRRSFALVSLPNGLYAIGGHDGKSFLKSVEMYDYESQNWVQIAPMNQTRSTHTAICTNDYQHILVFGGYENQDKCLKSVQVYNTIENKWFPSNEMQSERALHCSIIVKQ